MFGAIAGRAVCVRALLRPAFVPVTIAFAYYAAAEAAFLIGTLSDRIFAPFWPPNAILFCALLLTPREKWWAIIAAALPAHVLAELQVGMSFLQLLLAFLTNCALAIANAVAVRALLRGPPWFGSLQKAGLYMVATAVVNPALIALGGGFVPILGGSSLADYPYFVGSWYFGSALAAL